MITHLITVLCFFFRPSLYFIFKYLYFCTFFFILLLFFYLQFVTVYCFYISQVLHFTLLYWYFVSFIPQIYIKYFFFLYYFKQIFFFNFFYSHQFIIENIFLCTSCTKMHATCFCIYLSLYHNFFNIFHYSPLTFSSIFFMVQIRHRGVTRIAATAAAASAAVQQSRRIIIRGSMSLM